ncbi:MAG TPA: ribonuclease P protein component [Patescibacteria group bacterium]|nr:ribonuclease P protein component [Patescibacteria group bacterium]
MLPKEVRLPAKVRLVRAQSYSSLPFLCKYTSNNLPTSRFGFVVRKTLDKRATVRNRIRRVFRSLIEELLPRIQTGHDLLFILNRELLEMKREEMYNRVYAFLKEKQLLQ